MTHNNHLTNPLDLNPRFYKGYEYRVYKAFRNTQYPKNEGYEYIVFDEDGDIFDSRIETANSQRGFTKSDAIQCAKNYIDEIITEE